MEQTMDPTERPGNDSTHYLRAVIEATTKESRADALAQARTPEAMDLLADDWEDDEQRKTLTTLFSSLEATPGCTVKARSLRKAIEGLASTRRTDARLDQLVDEITTTSLASALDGSLPPESLVAAPVLADLCVPRGYRLAPNGVYKLSASPEGDIVSHRIAATPIFIVGRTVDVLSSQAYRQVVWLTAQGWASRVVDRRTLCDGRQILGLASYEAPVSSNTSGQIVSWLSEFEAENLWRFSTVQTTPRMGWQPDGSFMLPDQHYALTAAGWQEAVVGVSEYPIMMIAIYAAAASPLLHIFNMPGFVVDICGETSGGKTTALRLAASVWGKPSDSYPTAMYSWDATRVWIERTAGCLYNLPLILDETKRVKNPGSGPGSSRRYTSVGDMAKHSHLQRRGVSRFIQSGRRHSCPGHHAGWQTSGCGSVEGWPGRRQTSVGHPCKPRSSGSETGRISGCDTRQSRFSPRTVRAVALVLLRLCTKRCGQETRGTPGCHGCHRNDSARPPGCPCGSVRSVRNAAGGDQLGRRRCGSSVGGTARHCLLVRCQPESVLGKARPAAKRRTPCSA